MNKFIVVNLLENYGPYMPW